MTDRLLLRQSLGRVIGVAFGSHQPGHQDLVPVLAALGPDVHDEPGCLFVQVPVPEGRGMDPVLAGPPGGAGQNQGQIELLADGHVLSVNGGQGLGPGRVQAKPGV